MTSTMNEPLKNNDLRTATQITPLQLNAIKLDVRHTVLTPEYLEDLLKKQSSTDQPN